MSTEIIRQAVLDWHRFLHQFFRAEIPAEAFEAFAKALAPEFKYIAVWGDMGGRETFLESVPEAYGILPTLDVYAEDIEVLELAPDVFLASFVQVETFPDLPHKRQASAILRLEQGEVKWVRFHLTLIDPKRQPNLDQDEANSIE